MQNVDVVKSLETTLTILNHKLKRGVEVERDYQPVPLLVDSFGSELNQVWTNIIDNAIDAMHGRASKLDPLAASPAPTGSSPMSIVADPIDSAQNCGALVAQVVSPDFRRSHVVLMASPPLFTHLPLPAATRLFASVCSLCSHIMASPQLNTLHMAEHVHVIWGNCKAANPPLTPAPRRSHFRSNNHRRKPDEERRRAARFRLVFPVTMRTKDGREHECATRDIGTAGAFFYCTAARLPACAAPSPLSWCSSNKRCLRR